MKFSKKQFLVLAIFALTVVVLAFVFSRSPLFAGTPRYAAVYTDTGDLYFGKLALFPKLTMNDAWVLQRDVQQNTSSIVRFSDAAWKPTGVIHFERDHVVFWAPIAQGSQMIDAIEGRVQPQQQQPNGNTPSTPPNTNAGTTPKTPPTPPNTQ